MFRTVIILWQVLILGHLVHSLDNLATAITPRDCSLACIRQGGPGCDYCRISSDEISTALGLKSRKLIGSCIPWPCLKLLGEEDPSICQHYVQAPTDVIVEFLPNPDPNTDSVVVSWKPSLYGIAFLRGFQVILQPLGGSGVACQLFLFHQNLTLSASHAQRVYKSDPFPGLPLGSQFSLTVMALPVPEKWEHFYRGKIFSTRTCTEKNGFQLCKRDWYPQHVDVQQRGTVMTITFNLAPLNFGIKSYFSVCVANGKTTYTEIEPNYSKNKTHHSFELRDLKEGANYTCEIAANQMDAVRKLFNFQVEHREAVSIAPSWTLFIPVSFAAVVIVVVLWAVRRPTPRVQMKEPYLQADLTESLEEVKAQEEVMIQSENRKNPPRLLICYSSNDGPAHVNAVMKLGAFVQQHMATQVSLDLWDSLGLAEEGRTAWFARQIRESDFVLVICSRGLCRKSGPSAEGVFSSNGMVGLIGAEVGRAKSDGKDLSKYMAAIFSYSEETDIPTELGLVFRYRLTADLPLLFSQLHQVPLHTPGRYVKIDNISQEDFILSPAGQALQQAINESEQAMKESKERFGSEE
ncbi:interleukin-17 receptor D [Corythoichthys intestinalis]|uniref:interleukin-17 receptor D n=1 Tax=Corythoichthys intestinalis TaxID=161448 RepID=UPI0025A659FA|nr:interleukin-17 receptor D [Corythoichthys intestinalis]XP_061802772.1 interleukin-17 receptor D [Nerophis lumbriciformis]